MQAAHLAYEIISRPEMQVVGVAEYHRRAHLDEIVGVEGLYGRQSPNWHERGSIDMPVRRRENAGPCGASAGGDRE